ncbi:MFS transporter [Glaciimonas sp. PCH181]|uniref:MFS transporter n=1 Tax=Glaciimonas sp. PCH181 TaxID=2133943 RepID=UPI000D37FBF9|nr:MFS transporter [Glaciimonas sp. PCH181]PUA16636.1 multidrug transporter MdfA [Glaciimonas sp. PCH181]
MKKISTLNRSTLMFPLALVLFEFSVYIANDMIQPGMIVVTKEFGASATWMASAMTAFLLGGALFQWLFGPLSDRIGRRPVMLGGTVFFILACLATLFSNSIESFIVLRVVQGIGLCFISSVGYAVVQEAFEEKAAVKVTALMANVALIAPLIGPVAGAFMIEMWPWRMVFVFIAAVSSVALIGLVMHMPETVLQRKEKLPLMQIWHDYREVFCNRYFLKGALSIPLLAVPLIGWIAMSPLILVSDGHLSVIDYGLWQIPVFACLIAGNLILATQADRWRLGTSVKYALYPIAAGIVVMMVGSVIFKTPYFLVLGISLVSFGEGLSVAVLVRFTLTESAISKGTVAAAMGMVSMLMYGIGIELYKLLYAFAGMIGFALMSAVVALLYWRLSRDVVQRAMAARVTGHGVKQGSAR